MKTQKQRQKGTALILVMIMTMVAVGLVTALVITTQYSARQAELQITRDTSLALSETALNRVLEDIRTYTLANAGANWVEQDLAAGSQDTRVVSGTIDGLPYTVYVRSAYLAYTNGTAASGFLKDISATRDEAGSTEHDIYEVVAVSGGPHPDTGEIIGIGPDDYRSGIRAIIEIPKTTFDSQIPAPLYIEGDPVPDFKGNSFNVSGEDHDMEGSVERASIVMPYNGEAQITYEGSTAGLLSSLYLVDPHTGEDILIFADNAPESSYPTDNRTFTKGQALNFYAHTKGSKWGIGDYDHYTEGHDPYSGKPWCKKMILNDDDPPKTYLKDGRIEEIEMRDGTSNIYIKGTNEVVEPVLIDLNADFEQLAADYGFKKSGKDTLRVRFGIEDLPGRYYKDGRWRTPDWDWDDIVYVVDIVEDPGNNAEDLTETPWWQMSEEDALTGDPGKPAVAAKPIKQDMDTMLYVDGDGYLVNDAGEFVDADGKTLNQNQDPVAATSISEWDTETQYNNINFNIGEENARDQVRCDGTDASGEHVGFDKDAVDAGTASLTDRPMSFGLDAYNQSELDLRAMAAKLIGGTADNLPGDANSVKQGVQYMTDMRGNGNSAPDIGSKDDMRVTYVDGDTGTLAGKYEGGGVLVVNGDCKISGQFAFAGVVIVLGDVSITGGGQGTHILGSLLVSGEVSMSGNADIWWSQRAVANAGNAANYTPDFLTVSRAWRELDKGDIDEMGL